MGRRYNLLSGLDMLDESRHVFPSFPRCLGAGYSQVTDYVWDTVNAKSDYRSYLKGGIQALV